MPLPVPPHVSTGQPVASTWGNQVSDKFTEVDGRFGNIVGGIATVTTDSNGFATVGFGVTFPFVPVVVANLFASDPGNPLIVQVSNGTTATYAVFTVNTSAGFKVQNTSVQIAWIAFTGGM